MTRAPEQEYLSRIARVGELMEEVEIDDLLITGDRNVFYFTGYKGMVQLARPRFVFISQKHEPTVVVPANLAVTLRELCPSFDVRVYRTMGSTPIRELLDLLREKAAPSSRIGVEIGYEQRIGMPFVDFATLRNAAEQFYWVDASDLLWRARSVKTEWEQAMVRKAAEGMARAIRRAFNRVHPAMTEIAVEREFLRAFIDEDLAGGHVDIVSGQGHYFRTMAPPRERPLRFGDMLWVDAMANFGGYWADYSRAGVVGPPTDEQTATQRAIHETTLQGLSAIRPGVATAAVAAVCNEEMRRRNLQFNSGALRWGHGIGVDPTETPHIADYDETILAKGMVIALEPSTHTDYGRFNVEENVIVTDNGCEPLASIPWELFEIED